MDWCCWFCSLVLVTRGSMNADTHRDVMSSERDLAVDLTPDSDTQKSFRPFFSDVRYVDSASL